MISKELFARGILTPGEYKAAHGYTAHDVSRSGKIWSTSAVVRVLDDERYTGTYIIGKREVTEFGGNHVRMKDESQWVKIPDHHPAVISKDLFEQVQQKRRHIKCPKKNTRAYALKGKVFCGHCRHALTRSKVKSAYLYCRHTLVDINSPCHGLTISEQDLENLLFEILSKQAQAILNLPDLSHAGRLDVEIAKQTEYGRQIEGYLDQKWLLYERFLLKQISLEDYTSQKATIDRELEHLRELHATLKARTSQMQMDEKQKAPGTCWRRR